MARREFTSDDMDAIGAYDMLLHAMARISVLRKWSFDLLVELIGRPQFGTEDERDLALSFAHQVRELDEEDDFDANP